MPFTLNVIVPRPAPTLIEHMRAEARHLTQVTRRRLLVVKLRPDFSLSCETYPVEWRDKGADYRWPSRFVPDFTGGVVRTVYRLDDELAGSSYRLTLEKAEAGIRGSYCQVVTGYQGERLRPYRRENQTLRSDKVVHPTVSHFTAAELGVIRFSNYVPPRVTLTIRRARISAAPGLVTVTEEQAFFDEYADLASQRLSQLPPELGEWEQALRALHERLECRAQSCAGHYHLE